MQDNLGDASPRPAPLARAFRRFSLTGGRPPYVEFSVPARKPGGLCAETMCVPTDRARMTRTTRQISSGSGFPRLPKGTEHDATSAIRAYEDSMCHEKLRSLGSVKKTYEWTRRSTLLDLKEFVANLDKARPYELQFDAVIINPDMYNALFEISYGKPLPAQGCVFPGIIISYKNMIAMGRFKFLCHPRIPIDCAYALSSEQAPVFVYGPSTTTSINNGQEVSRPCGFVEPPPGMPECPWGVRFGVRRVCDTDGASRGRARN